jgi:hypothetical protein
VVTLECAINRGAMASGEVDVLLALSRLAREMATLLPLACSSRR